MTTHRNEVTSTTAYLKAANTVATASRDVVDTGYSLPNLIDCNDRDDHRDLNQNLKLPPPIAGRDAMQRIATVEPARIIETPNEQSRLKETSARSKISLPKVNYAWNKFPRTSNSWRRADHENDVSTVTEHVKKNKVLFFTPIQNKKSTCNSEAYAHEGNDKADVETKLGVDPSTSCRHPQFVVQGLVKALVHDDKRTTGHASEAEVSAYCAAEPHFACICLEVFGGSARLTKHFCKLGYDGNAIDWVRNASRPEGPSVLLDLCSDTGRRLLTKLLTSGRVAYTHFAPPCGTASKAREIPIRPELLKGRPPPIPLRSNTHPNGLPDLHGEDAERVHKANLLYELTAEAIWICHKNGILWSCENPRSSWFWETSWMKSLAIKLRSSTSAYLSHSFQNCAYGGKRPKWSTFWSNIPEFTILEEAGKCPENHEHLPWGLRPGFGFATGEEAAYPDELCEKVAGLVHRALVRIGKSCTSTSIIENYQLPTTAGMQAAESGKQSRGAKAPRLIPEYNGVTKFCFDKHSDLQVLEGQILSQPVLALDGEIPTGARVLRTQQNIGGMRAVFCAMPWTTESFLERALSVKHPIDTSFGLEPEIYDNIFWILISGPLEVARFREQQVAELRLVIHRTKSEEEKLHEKISSELQALLRPKNFTLMKYLMMKMDYKDTKLLDRMMEGFSLSGKLEESYVFEKRVSSNPHPVPKEEAATAARLMRSSVIKAMGPSADSAMDTAISEATKKEKENGWLKGPFTPEELTARHGDMWMLARRFGLLQSGKYRPIDDFSEFGQNSTMSTNETIPLGGVDAIVGLAKAMLSWLSDKREIDMPDGRGGKLRGILHNGWTLSAARSIVARCVDLKGAYKQLARRREDASISIILTWNSVLQAPELYESVVLPFGASGSVFGFNRASIFLRRMFIKVFRMTLTSFFDDYPCLEYETLAKQSGDVLEEVLMMLGWGIATDKLLPFSKILEAIGVQFDFAAVTSGGCIVIGNTPKRREAVSNEIKGIMKIGTCSQPQAASLKGRLSFCEAQHFGRCGTLAAGHLSARARGIGLNIISADLVNSLKIALWIVEFAPPRILSPWVNCDRNLIFLDGAAEGSDPQVASAGGVIFSPRLKGPEFFGFEVDIAVVAHWTSAGSKQVIDQAELFPALVAKRTWRHVLECARNIYFIDNESARNNLIRSNSSSWASREILLCCKIEDIRTQSLDWYARVPSAANVADAPSRLKFCSLLERGMKKIAPDVPQMPDFVGIDVHNALCGRTS